MKEDDNVWPQPDRIGRQVNLVNNWCITSYIVTCKTLAKLYSMLFNVCCLALAYHLWCVSSVFDLRWLNMVFILCAHVPLLNFWVAVVHMLFSHTQFLILQYLDFVNLSAIFLSLFLQFPSENFFKIWQHGKTRFRFDDESFIFFNQKLQYFLTMKTTYFNITEKLTL